jgi:hypothetical protein
LHEALNADLAKKMEMWLPDCEIFFQKPEWGQVIALWRAGQNLLEDW